MTKKLFSVIGCFILISGSITLCYADTRIIKVTVDSLAGETDVEDNILEREVTIVEQGYSDLGVLDIKGEGEKIIKSPLPLGERAVLHPEHVRLRSV